MQTEIIAKAVIISPAREILALRRSKTDVRRPLQWDLPGGMCEPYEQPLEAAVRETQEETGLIAQEVRLIFSKTEVREWVDQEKDSHITNVVFLFYLAHPNDAHVTLSNEHVESRWMSIEEAIKEFEYPLHIELFKHLRDNKLITA